jgi:predicted ATPase
MGVMVDRITHVSVRNYKSLAEVDVDLGPLTVLVGPNGAGKSNFVDALRFVSYSLWLGLDVQIARRGGIDSLLCQTSREESPTIHFSLDMLIEGAQGAFTFDLTKDGRGSYHIAREKFMVAGADFERVGTASPADARLEFDPTSLALSSIGTTEPFSRIRRYLTGVRCYQIYPGALRMPQEPVVGPLMGDGSNLVTVLEGMEKYHKEGWTEILNGLMLIIPDITDIKVENLGGLHFVKLEHRNDGEIATFDLSQESDGTIYLLSLLTALYQQPLPTLIAIEEPELFVHPGALFALYEMIKEVSQRTQIILTTHSPDLISYVDPEELRIVENVGGVTKIAPLDEGQVEIIREKLFSAGELLHVEGLRRRSVDSDATA